MFLRPFTFCVRCGLRVPAKLVGAIEFVDLAVVKVDVRVPAVAALGDSSALKPVEKVKVTFVRDGHPQTATVTLGERLEARRAEAVKAAGEVTCRTRRLYMSASAHGFESGNINVNQTLLAKMAQGGKSNIPLTRADLYAA